MDPNMSNSLTGTHLGAGQAVLSFIELGYHMDSIKISMLVAQKYETFSSSHTWLEGDV